MSKGHFEIGTRFGDWTVIAQVERTIDPPARGSRRAFFSRVRCECGTEKELPNARLRAGQSNGCGCRRGRALAYSGVKHNRSRTTIYRLWASVKHRIKNDRAYEGVKMHEPWVRDFVAFETFIQGLGPKPTPLHSLDRIDPSGNYEPSNLRWADKTLQSVNRRNSILRDVESRSKVVAGQRFDRLVVLDVTVTQQYGRNWYAARVKCDCGTVKTVKQQSLLRGRTRSCGCFKTENLAPWAKEGASPYAHPLAQPITVDGETKTTAEWARRLGTSIQTIRQRVKAGWDPARAATEPVRESDNLVTIDGETKSLADWCREKALPYHVVHKRVVTLGWDPVQAVTVPKRVYKRASEFS